MSTSNIQETIEELCSKSTNSESIDCLVKIRKKASKFIHPSTKVPPRIIETLNTKRLFIEHEIINKTKLLTDCVSHYEDMENKLKISPKNTELIIKKDYLTDVREIFVSDLDAYKFELEGIYIILMNNMKF